MYSAVVKLLVKSVFSYFQLKMISIYYTKLCNVILRTAV